MSDPAPEVAVKPTGETRGRNPHGSFIWYELLTTDPDAAAIFYGNVVGWRTRSAGQGGVDYRLFSIDGTDIGGLMKSEEGMPPPVWLGYIGVDDVDAAATTIKEAGGAIHVPPTDIPNVGRFAMVGDPQGVVFYIMRGNMDQASTAFAGMTPGHCRWNELVTTDQAAAIDFYIDQFGWEKGDAMPMGEAGDYRFINHHGEMIGAMMNGMGGEQRPMWNFYFGVRDIDEAVEAVRANDGTITFGPQEIPGGEYAANAIDPQGAAFGLVGPRQ